MRYTMTPRKQTILLVSDDAALRAAARHELETVDGRRHVSSVSSVDAARRIVADSAPAVILFAEAVALESGDPHDRGLRLDMAVSSLASYAPVVVIGDAEHQPELSGLVAAGAADYVVRNDECLNVALGLVERRLRKAQEDGQTLPSVKEIFHTPRREPLWTLDREDFGEVLRHELNNPLTGILGNAELLLSEIRRRPDGRLPLDAHQRLETIASLAVRLRESVRRLSQQWEARQPPVPTP
jgi:signal transduction histidine kinase